MVWLSGYKSLQIHKKHLTRIKIKLLNLDKLKKRFHNMEVTLLNFILVLTTLIALITNSLLIVFASKIPKKSKDIPLIIMIAAIEYFGPLPLIIDLIYSKFYDHGLIETRIGCNLSGTITSIVFFFEIALSAFLAIERLSLFVKLKTTKILFSYLAISCLIFISLLISSASIDGFTPTLSEFTCLYLFLSYDYYYDQPNHYNRMLLPDNKTSKQYKSFY
ncbi:hypothetical protein K502DRAFT_339922 [Neoconidiobolus thromboides FSU 785]|nr:hypothetical protein K502DRAFT_339922 [Neoconidiobolus thromboides FSU 785]